MPIPTVLCPLSGFPDAERALPSSVDAAKALGAPLQFFSAVEDQHEVRRRHQYLEGIGATVSANTGQPPTFDVQVDPHAPRALAAIAAAQANFVVMATSSQPLLHPGYVGSAAERVARAAHNPVLLIGPHAHVRLSDVERVVVPCDGSSLSEDVLIDASEWARRLNVNLWVVTSISPRAANQSGYSLDAETNYVRRLATQVDGQWEVLHGTDPAQAIVDWAGPALIAMTTHGRSGFSRLTIGSVAVGVTRWSTAPVLVSNGHAGCTS